MPCEQRFLSCMTFNVNEVVPVACQSRSWFVLYATRETFSPFFWGVKKSGTRHTTSHANDFVNAKGRAREKLLFAGKKSRSPSWLFDILVQPSTLKQRLLLRIDWRQKRAHLLVWFISLIHSAYITFRIIMSFRKPYHMPFRKLIPSFTLNGWKPMVASPNVGCFLGPALFYFFLFGFVFFSNKTGHRIPQELSWVEINHFSPCEIIQIPESGKVFPSGIRNHGLRNLKFSSMNQEYR